MFESYIGIVPFNFRKFSKYYLVHVCSSLNGLSLKKLAKVINYFHIHEFLPQISTFFHFWP